MGRILKKLFSRKFIVTIAAGIVETICAFNGIPLPKEILYTAAAYVIGESAVDTTREFKAGKNGVYTEK